MRLRISVTILSVPPAVFRYILASSDFASDFNVCYPSIFLCIVGCHFSLWKGSTMYSFTLSCHFPFSIISVLFIYFSHPVDTYVLSFVISLILLSISALSVKISFSISTQFSSSHASFTRRNLSFISLRNILYSPPYNSIVYSVLFLMSKN